MNEKVPTAVMPKPAAPPRPAAKAPDNSSTPIDLSVLIVTYNGRDVVLEALSSLFQETQTTRFEVILVDNASADGVVEGVTEQFPSVKVIARQDNLGFAGGNNLAARHARGRRLLLLNPDTVTLRDGVGELWRFAERTPDAGIWGGRTLFADGSLNITSVWSRMTPWALFCRAFGLTYLAPKSNLFNPETIGGWQRDSEREVDIVTGCFLMIDTDLWNELGGFNEDFFMYGEEADLCLRAREHGARPRMTPDATIVHHGGISETSATDKLIKVLKGKSTLMHAHWSPMMRPVGRGLFWILAASRAMATKLFKPTKRAGHATGGDDAAWTEVFRRRNEWIGGWPLRNASNKSKTTVSA